jgi:hypothetical protein
MDKQRLLELAGVLNEGLGPKKGYQTINDLTATFWVDLEDLQPLAEMGLMFVFDGLIRGRAIIKPLFRSRADVERELNQAGIDFEFTQN